MTEELDILKVIAENPLISQRKIAQVTGISLGQVNFLIKKCAKKGLLKIDGQTPKSIRYNITPKGIAEKASLTLEYIKMSYGAVIKLTQKISELADKYRKEGLEIYVFGPKDEMMELMKIAIGEIKSIDTINTFDNVILFYWDEESIKYVQDLDKIQHVNVLQ